MAGSQKQRDELAKNLLALQMESIGKTYQDAMATPEFWRTFSITDMQRADFERRALFLIKKTLKCNRTKALEVLEFFNNELGIK